MMTNYKQKHKIVNSTYCFTLENYNDKYLTKDKKI